MKAARDWRRAWATISRVTLSNPVGFLFLFRWLTWALALLLVYTRSAPEANLRFQPGLLMYAAVQLAVGAIYSVYLHPRLRSPGGRVQPDAPRDLVAVGVADMAGSLALVYFSGGWGSPFWHYAVTSIMVSCFLLSAVWGTVTIVAYASAYVLIVAIAGDGLDGPMQVGQRNFFFGNLATAFLIALVVSYLGALFRTLQAQRLRTRQALDETEMLFRITENLVQGGTDVDDMLGRVTQVVRTSGLFRRFAVLLRDRDGRLQLATSSVGLEELPMELAHRAAQERCTRMDFTIQAMTWAAAPLLVGRELIGVVVVGPKLGGRASDMLQQFVEAVASQLAIGIHNASLARQKAELAAQEERTRIAREIHDGIAQSIYMLSLHLETCAELALQQRRDQKERLEKLVVLSKETLLEVRHYIFDLKPYLAGAKGVVDMVENQVREFNKVAGVPATLDASGAPRQVPVPVATCLYRVTQEALANAFKHANASQVSVLLEFQQRGVQLTVQDDGQGFDNGTSGQGNGLGNMRRRAEEVGGTFDLHTVRGAGTRVVIRLPA